MSRHFVRLLFATVVLPMCQGGCGGGTTDPKPEPQVTGVGPEGGTVVSGDNLASLVVPPGALASRVDIIVAPVTSGPLDAKIVKRSAYSVTPDVTFAVPATLSISYTASNRPGGTAEAELGTFVVDGSSWQQVTSTTDVTQHSVVATVVKNGTYAVRWTGPTASCTGAEYHQFDFWIGTWAYTVPNGFPGNNIITADPTGCAIYENFTQGASYRGRSVSFFAPADGKWYQTYVDSDAAHDIYVGTFVNGVMTLYRSPTERLSWIKLDDKRIRNVFEQSSDGGATWHVAGDALYSR